jgi:hypothetical protein
MTGGTSGTSWIEVTKPAQGAPSGPEWQPLAEHAVFPLPWSGLGWRHAAQIILPAVIVVSFLPQQSLPYIF